MLNFTLLVTYHILKFYQEYKIGSNQFVLHNPNPYTPSVSGDTELFRLNSRSSKLWKYTVIMFENSISVVL